MIITIRDVHAAGMCSCGARKFFKRHKLDWLRFVKHGLSADVLSSTGDAMAMHVIEVASGRR